MFENNEDQDHNHKLNIGSIVLFRKKLWPYVSRYKVNFYTAIAFVMLSTAATIFVPWFLGATVDRVLVGHRSDLIAKYVVIFLLVNGIKSVTMYMHVNLLTSLGSNVLHDLRQDLLKKYQFYPIAEFNRTPVGRMVTRLVNDTSSLLDLFTSGVAVAFADILIIIGVIIWMFFINFKMAAICLSVYPVMIFFSAYFGKKIHETFRNARAALSKLNSFLSENISGMWLIQLFGKERYFKTKFDIVSNGYTERNLRTVRMFSLFQPTITVLSSLSMAFLILYGGKGALSNTVTLGVLVAFISYIQALFTPIREITEKYNFFVAAMASCEKIFEFMDRQGETLVDFNAQIQNEIVQKGEIEFSNVSFAYSEKPILKNLNFKIKSGEKIGVVGHTGAGKTTLSTLLMRYYDPVSGKILIDGQDVMSFDRRAIRQSIGYIQQEPFIFSGTIEDNIFLWNEDRKKVFNELPDFVREPFLQGRLKLEKEVFEKGTNLSAGEKQIISFLRAIVHRPKILILDEATAHIDLLTERWIEEVSRYAFKDRTVLIIAHRLATLRSVDRILVFHHGELIEEGKHTDLKNRNGMYAKLYAIQTRKESIEQNS